MVDYCPICGKPVYFGESPICFAFANFNFLVYLLVSLSVSNGNICLALWSSSDLSMFLFKWLHLNANPV